MCACMRTRVRMHTHVHSVTSNSLRRVDCGVADSSVHGTFQARTLEWIVISYSPHLPDPGIESMSLRPQHWQADSLPLAPPGKPYECEPHPVS